MFKQLVDWGKTAFSLYKRLVDAEENNKKLEARANRQEEKTEHITETLKDVLYELRFMQQIVENNQAIIERDQRIFVLQIEAALRNNDPRALPPAVASSSAPDVEARLTALEQAVAELTKQVEALKTR